MLKEFLFIWNSSAKNWFDVACKDACDNRVWVMILKAIYFGLCEGGTAAGWFLHRL